MALAGQLLYAVAALAGVSVLVLIAGRGAEYDSGLRSSRGRTVAHGEAP